MFELNVLFKRCGRTIFVNIIKLFVCRICFVNIGNTKKRPAIDEMYTLTFIPFHLQYRVNVQHEISGMRFSKVCAKTKKRFQRVKLIFLEIEISESWWFITIL